MTGQQNQDMVATEVQRLGQKRAHVWMCDKCSPWEYYCKLCGVVRNPNNTETECVECLSRITTKPANRKQQKSK